eukprot:9602213-Heterocapsa_arctica.AAC.1
MYECNIKYDRFIRFKEDELSELSEHRSRGWRTTYVAGLKGKGSRNIKKGVCCLKTPATVSMMT